MIFYEIEENYKKRLHSLKKLLKNIFADTKYINLVVPTFKLNRYLSSSNDFINIKIQVHPVTKNRVTIHLNFSYLKRNRI